MSIFNIKQSFILYKHLAIFTRLCLFVNTRCVYSTQLRGSFCSRMLRQISHLFVLIQLCDEWYENMDQGKLNGVVFLDIPNAFDSIDHKILISKLETHFSVSNTELNWFESYLINREHVSLVATHRPPPPPPKIVCGIPQGSILGPSLFLLHIND